MGFLENKKIPDSDKRFLFRHDSITAIKYSISNFINSNNIYYPNLFYIEGADGTGKTWLLSQVELYSKNLSSANFLIKLETKDIIYSEVTGAINFLYNLRNVIVSKNQDYEKTFEKFDNAYKSFLAGTLTDDGVYSEIRIDSKEEAEPVKVSFNNNDDDEKPKNQIQRIDPRALKTQPQVKQMAAGKPLINTVQPKANPLANRKEGEVSVAPRKGTGQLNTAVSAYNSLHSYSEKEVPKKKSGQADVRAIAKSLTNVVDSIKKTPVRTIDFKSILFRKFLDAFEIITESNKVILLIDEFEKIQQLQSFFFSSFLKNLKNEIIVVVAGEADMEKILKQRYDTNLGYIYISNFGYLHLEEYFKKFHVLSDPSVVEAVYELTEGIPLGLAMVGSAFQNFKGDVFKIMKYLSIPEEEEKSLRYINVITLDSMPQNERKVIILLSLLRNVDYDLIEHISSVFNAKSMLKTLSDKYYFLDPIKGLHETLKKYTRTYAKHEMTNLYEEIYRLSLDYFKDKITQDPDNRENIIDYIYYQIRVNEDIGYTILLGYVSQFVAVDINFCEQIIHNISGTGISKELRNKLNNLRESFPYIILKDHKRTLPVLEAIAEMQNRNPAMNLLDTF